MSIIIHSLVVGSLVFSPWFSYAEELSLPPVAETKAPQVVATPATVTETPATAEAAAPAVPSVKDAPVLGKAIPGFKNINDIAQVLKLKDFKGRKFGRHIKVAVIDNGFTGYEAELGKGLPADTKYYNGKASSVDDDPNPQVHGVFLAKLLAKIIATSGADADYELHLFKGYGTTKFLDAVQNVAAGHFDVVLYAQVWEYGGNFDGTGFVNAAVDKVLNSGAIWINAAGPFGKMTRMNAVDGKMEDNDEFVVFKNSKGKSADSVKIRCNAPAKKKCSLSLVLTWNDFKKDITTDKDGNFEIVTGTEKDLDLFVYDAKKKVIASSQRVQKAQPDLTDPNSSVVPREWIDAKDIDGATTYDVRVKIRSKNFSPGQDQLRLTASGPGVEVLDPDEDETLLPPSDNPGVIVIGASDEIQTSHSKKMNRPETYIKSIAIMDDGSTFISTSNAAAMAAAVTVLRLGVGPEKTRDDVVAALKKLSVTPATPDKIVPTPKVTEGNGSAKTASSSGSGGRRSYSSSVTRQNVRNQTTQVSGGSVQINGGGPIGPPLYRGFPGEPCLSPIHVPVYPELQQLFATGRAVAVMWRGFPAVVVSFDYAIYAALPRIGGIAQFYITPSGPNQFDIGQILPGTPGVYPIIEGYPPICH